MVIEKMSEYNLTISTYYNITLYKSEDNKDTYVIWVIQA